MTHTTTYRRKDSGWQIIVSWKDADGKWHQKSKQGFAKKADAKAAEADLIKSIKKTPRPVDRSMNGITLTDFCESYIKVKKMISGTAKTYTSAVKFLGSVAKKPIHTITYLDIQTVISESRKKTGTVETYCSKLKVLFRAAIKPYHIISENPMEDVDLPKVHRKERLTISEADFNKILTNVKPQTKLALAISYYTGIRKAELLALTWDDIHDMTLTINKQLNDTHTGQLEVVGLKTNNGYRTIPIPAVLKKMLNEYRSTQPIAINGCIFYRPMGTYRLMTKALKSVNKDLTVHCLRHTYATQLLARGMDIRTVAALLGDNVNTVINVYVHYTDEMREAAAKDIQKIFA